MPFSYSKPRRRKPCVASLAQDPSNRSQWPAASDPSAIVSRQKRLTPRPPTR